MCMNPVTLALMVGGQLASMQGQRAVAKAQANAVNAQVARNAMFQGQADKIMDEKLMPGFEMGQQNQVLSDAKTARLADSEALAGGGYDLPMAESAGADYKSELGNLIADKVQQGRLQAEAATRIGSYGDLALNNANLLTDGGIGIGQINQNVQREGAILPYELQAAQSKGQGWSTLGDLLSGAGTIYSLGGGANIFAKPGGAMAPIVEAKPTFIR